MKKLKSIIVYSVIGMLLFNMIPIEAHAETMQDYIDKVNQYTAELQAKKDKLAKNDAEIKKIEEEIIVIEGQIEQIKKDQEELQKQIEKNNQEIAAKKKESKELIRYAQVSQGDNFYLDYIFGADSLTDMIYRISLVEQITKYNNKVVKTLNKLIEDNKNKKIELAKKDEELKKLTEDLSYKKEQIGLDSASIREGMPTIEEQIKQAQNMVSFYENKGCSPSDVIGVDCAVIKPATGGGNNGGNIGSTGAFIRPMYSGYVTSPFGGRSFDNFHYGIDLSSSNKRQEIYPIAPGMIYYKGYDIYGALVVRIAHNYNGRIVGSTYVHMSSFGPGIYVGMEVDTDTLIGYMGNTGNSYGAHLHLEVSDCPYLYAGSACTGWNSYINYLYNNWQDPADYISFPDEWSVR